MDIIICLEEKIEKLQMQKNLLKRIGVFYGEFIHEKNDEERSKSAKELYKLVKSYFDKYVTNIGGQDWQMCEQINRRIARYLDEDKDGKFTRKDFSRLAKIIEDKEKEYKRFEFSAMIQAYFTLAMWKRVCSEQGESDFVAWIKKLVINNNEKIEDESDEDTENPDPMKYVDRTNLKMLYDVLNVKTTHGIDFQSFFELMKITSDDMEEEGTANEEFVLISVLDFFCVNFIRGFSKLILDLGFDSFMETEFDYE